MTGISTSNLFSSSAALWNSRHRRCASPVNRMAQPRVTFRCQKDQLLENGGCLQKAAWFKAATNDVQCVEDVFLSLSEVQGDVGVNRDERPSRPGCRHKAFATRASSASGARSQSGGSCEGGASPPSSFLWTCARRPMRWTSLFSQSEYRTGKRRSQRFAHCFGCLHSCWRILLSTSALRRQRVANPWRRNLVA
jgi:hypothetical protein